MERNRTERRIVLLVGDYQNNHLEETMGKILRFHTHARASAASSGTTAKSSAVTAFSVTVRKATAKSFESQTLPRRSREMVVRLQETPVSRMRAAMPSSSNPADAMNSDSFMAGNVHQMHNQVNPLCASVGMELKTGRVHAMHMARKSVKRKPEKPPKWRVTHLRAWRDHAGLSLEVAAPAMGLKHSQLSRIERGHQAYSQKVLEIAEKLYKTSIWALLYCPPNTSPEEAIANFLKSSAPPPPEPEVRKRRA